MKLKGMITNIVVEDSKYKCQNHTYSTNRKPGKQRASYFQSSTLGGPGRSFATSGKVRCCNVCRLVGLFLSGRAEDIGNPLLTVNVTVIKFFCIYMFCLLECYSPPNV